MRRFPSSWDKTLAALGFRRNIKRVKREFNRRHGIRIESLERREMLSVSPNEGDYQAVPTTELSDDTLVESIRPEYVLADSAAGDTPEQFEISTEYTESGQPTAVIKLKEGLERIDRSLQELTVELRLGQSVLARHEVLIDIAESRFVHDFQSARVAALPTATETEVTDAKEWVTRIDTEGRFEDLGGSRSSLTPELQKVFDSQFVLQNGVQSRLEASHASSKITTQETAETLERFSKIANQQAADPSLLASAADRANFYKGLEQTLAETPAPQRDQASDQEDAQRLDELALSLGKQIQRDLSSDDSEVVESAMKARAGLLSKADPYYTMLNGFDKNHELESRAGFDGRTEFAINIVEEGTLAIDDTIRVELGDYDAMVQTETSWMSGGSQSFRSAALSVDFGPFRDATVRRDDPTANDNTDRLGVETIHGAFVEAGGQVSIEAENFHANVAGTNDDWVTRTDKAGYSGDGFVRAELDADGTPGYGDSPSYLSGSPRLDYEVEFSQAGTYYVWVRGLYTGGQDDSLHIGVNNQANTTADRIVLGGASNSFNWSRSRMSSGYAQITIPSAGTHTINLWMREDGARVDKLLLTTNGSYTPTLDGPAESATSTPIPTTASLLGFDLSAYAGSIPTSATLKLKTAAADGAAVSLAASNELWGSGHAATWDESSVDWDDYETDLLPEFGSTIGQATPQVGSTTSFNVTETLQRSLLLGDSNLNSEVDRAGAAGDIEAFYLAATDFTAYTTKYAGLEHIEVSNGYLYRNDANVDGVVDATDAAPYFERMGVPRGDFNLDGEVDGKDYSVWAANFGASAERFGQGDADLNSVVDTADYTVWSSSFGETTTAPTSPDVTFRLLADEIGQVEFYSSESAVSPPELRVSIASRVVVQSFDSVNGDLRVNYEVQHEDATEPNLRLYQVVDGVRTLLKSNYLLGKSVGLHEVVLSNDFTIADPDQPYTLVAEIFSEESTPTWREFDGGVFETSDGKVHAHATAGDDTVVFEDGRLTVSDSSGEIDAYTAGSIDFGDVTLVEYDAQTTPVGGNTPLYESRDDGQTLYLENNVWKAIALPYTVTANTVVEFDYESSLVGELHGFGFDDDLGLSGDRLFRLHGTQSISSDWKSTGEPDYQLSDGLRHYRIQVGDEFTGSSNHLFFIADNDATGLGNSVFSNFRVYEDVVGSQPKVYVHAHGGDDTLAVENHTGADVILVGGEGDDLYEIAGTAIASSTVEVKDERGLDQLSLLDLTPSETIDLSDDTPQGFASLDGTQDAYMITLSGGIEYTSPSNFASTEGLGYTGPLTVTALDDVFDGRYVPGPNGELSLREALVWADAIHPSLAEGPIEVNFLPDLFDGSLKRITLSEIDEIIGGIAPLKIVSHVSLMGPGADELEIHAAGAPNAFDTIGSSVSLAGITIAGAGSYGVDSSGTLVLEEVEIRDNGRGVHQLSGTLYVSGSTIADNTGFGLLAESSHYSHFANSTFSNNSGGGLFNHEGHATLEGVTLVGNGSNGVHTAYGADTKLVNSLIVGHTTDLSVNYGSHDPNSKYNLYGTAGLGAGLSVTTNQDGVSLLEAKLSDLGDHGGETRTHALLVGSPAIDAGDSILNQASSQSHDQRGKARVQVGKTDTNIDRLDIGAYEYQLLLDLNGESANGNDHTITYVEDAGLVELMSAIDLPGITQIPSVTIAAISDPASIDKLFFSTDDATYVAGTPAGLVVTESLGQLTLTLSGSSATADWETYRAALRNLYYLDSSQDLVDETLTFDITVDDGSDDHPIAQFYINLFGINDVPKRLGGSGSVPASSAFEGIDTRIQLSTIQVADDDISPTANLSLIIKTTAGSMLSVESVVPGISITDNDEQTVTLTGTLDEINTWLADTATGSNRLDYRRDINLPAGTPADSVSVWAADVEEEFGYEPQFIASLSVNFTAQNDSRGISFSSPAQTTAINKEDTGAITLGGAGGFTVTISPDEENEVSTAYTAHVSLVDPLAGELVDLNASRGTLLNKTGDIGVLEDWIESLSFDPHPLYGGSVSIQVTLTDTDDNAIATTDLVDAPLTLVPKLIPTVFVVNSLRDFRDSNTSDWYANTGREDHPYGREVTLRAAIEQANALSTQYANAPGGPITPVIRFADGIGNGQEIDLDPNLGELVIETSLTIDGSGTGLLKIDGNASEATPSRVIQTLANTVVVIQGVEITGGYLTETSANGGAILALGDLTLADAAVTGSKSAKSRGGAIFSAYGGSLSIINSVLSGNEAVQGGAIWDGVDDGKDLYIEGSTLSGNLIDRNDGDVTPVGGALFATAGTDSQGVVTVDGKVTIFNSTIVGNISNEYNAGLDIDKIGTVSVANNTAVNNHSLLGGPGVLIRYSGNPTAQSDVYVYNNLFVDNTQGQLGAETKLDYNFSAQSNTTVNTAYGGNLVTSTSSALSPQFNVDLAAGAGLSALGEHGGATPTVAILSNSHAAVDAGVAIPAGLLGGAELLDQRGVARDAQPDAGAFEYVATSSASLSGIILGDFNGDGRDDEVTYDSSSQLVFVDLSGDDKGPQRWGETLTSTTFYHATVGDFNGDGRDDIAFREDTNAWTFGLSETNRFLWHHTAQATAWSAHDLLVGDFDGDGEDELIGRNTAVSNWGMLDREGSSFAFYGNIGGSFRNTSYEGKVFVGDANRDGRDDLIGIPDISDGSTSPSNSANGAKWYARLSSQVEPNGNLSPSGVSLEGGEPWGDWFDGVDFDTSTKRIDADAPIRFVTEQFAEVYNIVELELYHGIRKGPQATLETQAASPWDQAALLTQLLSDTVENHNRFDPTLVTGEITVPVETAAAWVGAKDNGSGVYPALPSLLKLLDPQYSGTNTATGGTVSFRHSWVRVKLPRFDSTNSLTNNPTDADSNGDNYIDFDPSWKFKDRQDEIVLPSDLFSSDGFDNGLFDELKYLDASVLEDIDPDNTQGFNFSPETPLEFFESELQAWITSTYPGLSTADVKHASEEYGFTRVGLVPGNNTATLAATSVQEWGAYDKSLIGGGDDIVSNTQSSEDLLHRYSITVLTFASDTPIATRQLTELDPNAVHTVSATESGGSIDIDIRLGDTTVSSGTAAGISSESDIYVFVDHFAPGIQYASRTGTSALQTHLDNTAYAFRLDRDASLAIVVDALTISDALPEREREQLVEEGVSISGGVAAAEKLAKLGAAVRAKHVKITSNAIAGYFHATPSPRPISVATLASHDASSVITEGTALYGYAPENYNVDPSAWFDRITSDDNALRFFDRDTGAKDSEAGQLHAWTVSHRSDEIAAEIAYRRGLSTVAQLQRAYSGVPSYHFTSNGFQSFDEPSAVISLGVELDATGHVELLLHGYHASSFSDYPSTFSAASPAGGATTPTQLWRSELPYSTYVSTDDIETLFDELGGAVVNNTSWLTDYNVQRFASTFAWHNKQEVASYLANSIRRTIGDAEFDPRTALVQAHYDVTGGATTSFFGVSEGGYHAYATDVFGDEPFETITTTVTQDGWLGSGAFTTTQRVAAVQAGVPGSVVDGGVRRQRVDIPFANSGVSLSFERHYNSLSKRDIGLGAGWTHSFSDRLVRKEAGSSDLLWYTSSGTEHQFVWDSVALGYTTPPELRGTLQGNGDGTLSYTNRDGDEYLFLAIDVSLNGGLSELEPYAVLERRTDLNGNGVFVRQVNSTSNPGFVEIADVQDVHSQERRIEFEYIAGTPYILHADKWTEGDTNQRTTRTRYEYQNSFDDAQRRLTVVRHADVALPGEQSLLPIQTYSYHGQGSGSAGAIDGLMQAAIAPNGDEVRYAYFGNGRVFSVQAVVEHGAVPEEDITASVTYSYDLVNGKTVTRDANGNETTFFFNEEGLITRVINPDRTRTEAEWGVPLAEYTGGVDDDGDGIADGTEFLRTEMTDEVGAVESFAYYAETTPGDGAYERELASSTSKRVIPLGATDLVQDGVKTLYKYVKKGSTVRVKEVEVVHPSGPNRTTLYSYEANGLLASATDPEQNVTTYEYYDTGAASNDGLLKSMLSPRGHAAADRGQLDEIAVWHPLADGVAVNSGVLTVVLTVPAGPGAQPVVADAIRVERLSPTGDRVEQTYIIDDADGITSGGPIIVDPSVVNAGVDAEFRVLTNGPVNNYWKPTSAIAKYGGDNTGLNRAGMQAVWRFDDLPSGSYRVATIWDAHQSPGRVSGEYTIFDGTTNGTQLAQSIPNQTVAPPGYNLFETSFSYNAAGLVAETRVGDKSRGSTSYHHTGQPTVSVDATGRESESVYDNLGRLISTSNLGQGGTADPLTSTFQYDASGQLRFGTDALGRVTETIYDNRGLVTQVVFADGTSMRYEYDGVSNRVSMTDELDRTTSYSYDSRNRLVRTTHPDGAAETMRYDGVGRLVETVDALGRRSELSYDAAGRLIKAVAAAGSEYLEDPEALEEPTPIEVVTYDKYNTLGDLIETRDGNGNVTQFEHDRLGRVIKTTVLAQADAIGFVADSNLRTALSARPVYVETTGYDAEGNVIERIVYDTLDEPGNLTPSVLNDVGLRGTLLDADSDGMPDHNGEAFQVTTLRYDNFGRPSETVYADGTGTAVEYDAAGRVRFSENELGGRTEMVYDAYGRLSETFLPDPVTGEAAGEDRPVSKRAYDAVGNVISTQDANGNVTTFGYDERNRLIATTDAVGSTAKTVFDTVGQVVATIDAHGVALAMRYDDRGRLTRRSWSDPDSTTADDDTSTAPFETYEYDDVGNLTLKTDARDYPTAYTYDDLNRLRVERSWRTHVSGGQIERLLTQPGGSDQDAVTRYEYDSNGNVTSTTDGIGGTTHYSYDELNRVETETLADPDKGGARKRLRFVYTYDGYSNNVETTEQVVVTEDQVVGLTHRVDTFAFDSRNRLVEEVFNSEAAGGDDDNDHLRNVYEYDLAGRLLALKEAVVPNGAGGFNPTSVTVTTRYAYDELGRLTSEHLDAPFASAAAGPLDGHSTAFEYDLNSNLLTETSTVRTAEGARSTTTAYEYDAVNRNTAVTEDFEGGLAATNRFAYDAVGSVIREIDASGLATSHRYDRLYRLVETTHPNPYDSQPTEEDPSAIRETFEYDTAGNLTAYENGEGERTQYLNNTFGQTIEERVDMPGGPADIVTVYKYDQVGNRTQVVDPGGNSTTFRYDKLSRVIREIQGKDDDPEDGDGVDPARYYVYNDQGNLISVTDRNGVTALDARVTEYDYDNLDRLVAERWFANAAQTQIQRDTILVWQYDKLGRVEAQGYQYINAANPSEVYPSTYLESFEYDPLGRVTKHRNYVPAGFSGFSGLLSNVSSIRNPRLDQNYVYDQLDGLTGNDLNSYLYTQTYVDTGAEYANSRFVTDKLGRLSRLTEDGNDLIAGDTKRAEKEVAFEYDLAGRMLNTTRNAAQSPNGPLNGFVFTTDYAYDASGRLESIDHVRGTGAVPFASHAYNYDRASRITSITATTEVSKLKLTRQEDFTYDTAGRLKTWDYNLTDRWTAANGINLNNDLDLVDFNPDAAGNNTDDGQVLEGQNQAGVGHNRVDFDGTYDYSYDLEGNLTRRTSRLNPMLDDTAYDWDHRNRLIRIADVAVGITDKQIVEYAYDNDDFRIRKTVYQIDTQMKEDILLIEHYVYDGDQLAAVIDGTWHTEAGGGERPNSNGIYQRRVQSGPGVDAPLFEEVFWTKARAEALDLSNPVNEYASDSVSAGLFWAATDHPGSVRDVLENSTYNLVDHLEYDSHGAIIQRLDPGKGDRAADELALDAAFAGREWDHHAELYYNRARWYDAEQGRFISEDPIGFAGGDANVYRYGGGDPVNFRDPTGLYSDGFGSAFGGYDLDFSFGFNDFSFDTNLNFDLGANFDQIGFGANDNRYGLYFLESDPFAGGISYDYTFNQAVQFSEGAWRTLSSSDLNRLSDSLSTDSFNTYGYMDISLSQTTTAAGVSGDIYLDPFASGGLSSQAAGSPAASGPSIGEKTVSALSGNGVTGFAVDVAIGFIPFVSEGRDFAELTSGYDMRTREKLSWWQRGLTGLGLVLPVVGGVYLRRLAGEAASYGDDAIDTVIDVLPDARTSAGTSQVDVFADQQLSRQLDASGLPSEAPRNVSPTASTTPTAGQAGSASSVTRNVLSVVGHATPWTQMTKAQRKAFQHSYSRHAAELGLPNWRQGNAEALRIQFNNAVSYIRSNGAKITNPPKKPYNDQLVDVNYYEADIHGTLYYYYETLSGVFISAGKSR